jgi:hypothetical protein
VSQNDSPSYLHVGRSRIHTSRKFPGNRWRGFSSRETPYVIVGIVILIIAALVVVYESSQPNFTIGLGDSLKRHLHSTPESIDVAEQFKLPIYEHCKGRASVRITYAAARQMDTATTTACYLKVPVYSGDHIDLRWGGRFVAASGKRPVNER